MQRPPNSPNGLKEFSAWTKDLDYGRQYPWSTVGVDPESCSMLMTQFALLKDGRFLYLACPFTYFQGGSDIDRQRIEELRFEISNRVAALLMRKCYIVFSPISHGYPIHKTGVGVLGDYSTWKDFSERQICICDTLAFIEILGWNHSMGVQDEIQHAYSLNKPIRKIRPALFCDSQLMQYIGEHDYLIKRNDYKGDFLNGL